VVDPVQLTSDILTDSISLALPGVLWALLFLVAWEHESFAESIGFGRRSFWLLLPGAIFASFALFPIAPVSNDWLAVSFAGAIFPLLVGLLAFGRAAPPRSRSLALYLGAVAVEGGLLFVFVLPSTSGISAAFAAPLRVTEYVGNDLLVLVGAVVFSTVLGGFALVSGDGLVRRVAFLVALTSGVLVTTFAAAAAIPGVGIAESFPIYLVPPISAGFASVAFAGRVFPKEEAFAIPTAFLAGTFGVLLGADLLRQPPLYGTGAAGLYTIGGAGVLDLVYLSGILAFGAAYLAHRAAGRGFGPVGPPLAGRAPSPMTRLLHAFRSGLDGHLSDTLTESSAASHAAADQARLLLGIGPAPEDRPWQGLGVPGWIVADQANLDSAARAGTADGREGFRSWLTARWLVLIGREIGSRRFATLGTRAVAFLLDLAVVTAPAALLWFAILEAIPGGLSPALTNLPFNAAIFGFIAWSFLYFVLTETYFGTTVGKWLLDLEVRERALESPSGLSALVRNSTVLPLLTVLGVGVALALAFGLKAGGTSTLTLGGVALPTGLLALFAVLVFVIGGIAVLGGGALVLIAATAERQRLGDLWAGTWVVKRASAPPTAATAPTESVPPSPQGPGPSG